MCASSLAPRSAAPPRDSAATTRRYELDWLRTGAVFGLIPFHTAVIFTTGSYDYVKNAQTSALMDIFTTFITIWGIPLLFLVAGGASRFALASRTTRQYLNERVARLLVPFTFGMLLIVPFQIYIGRLAAATPPPSFLEFYVGFLQTLLGVLTGHFPSGPEWIGHLWFIPLLMLFSALMLPFARLLRTSAGARTLGAMAGAWHGYATLALFGLPLAVVQFFALEGIGLLPTIDTRLAGNAIGVLAFLLFFLYGYLLYLDERFVASVRRFAWLALALGAVGWLALEFLLPGWSAVSASSTAGHVLQALLRGYSSWWWVMGILGLAIHYLNFSTPTVEYLTRAAYPVYIIHMPILSIIALWVVRLDMGILVKYGLIVVASLAASLAVYEFIIQRVGVLRLLFGLRTAPRGARTPPPDSAPPTRRAATPGAAKPSSHTNSDSLRRRAGQGFNQAQSG